MAHEQSGEDFHWNEAGTVIRPVQAVAVYLRQQSDLGEDDAVVVIPATELHRLIAALQALAEGWAP